MEIINKSKLNICISECRCGAILKAEKSELRTRYNEYLYTYYFYGDCPSCGYETEFKEISQEKFEEEYGK